MRVLRKIIKLVDSTNDTLGRVCSFTVLILAAILCSEVILRSIFNAPTIWAHESTQYFYGVLILIGGAYALVHGAHVRVEILHERWSKRGQAIADIISSFLFFILIIVAFKIGLDLAIKSVTRLEASGTVWNPPVYPLKITVVIGTMLMLMQGIAKLIKDIVTVVTGKDLL